MDILKESYLLHSPCKNIPYIYELRKEIKRIRIKLEDKLHLLNMLVNDLRVQIEDLKAETERLKSHKESALSWIDYRDSDSQDEIDLMNKHKWHKDDIDRAIEILS